MLNILKASLIFRALAAARTWLNAQWIGSCVVGRFLREGGGESLSEGGVFSRAGALFHRGLCAVYEKLRLEKLLRNSIFTMPYLWCFAALALAPLMPTMALLAVSVVSMISMLLAFACDRERRLVYFPSNKYIFIFAFVYLAATFTSVTVSGSLLGGALTTFFVLFAIVVQNAVTTRRQLRALICAFIVSGVLVSAYGIYQYVFGAAGASAWVDAEMFSAIGMRVYSTLENPNVLAEYLLLVTPFAGAYVIISKGAIRKLFFLGCLAVLLLCMLLTFARGGWLGLVIAAAVFLIMIDRRFVIVGIAGLVILYYTLPEVVLDRFLSIGNIGDSSTSYRVFIWMGTIAMLRDYWFTGIGPGTAAFGRIYPRYSFNTVAAPHSHNLFLQIICDAGICGIIVFLAILFTYLRRLCSAVSREGKLIHESRGGGVKRALHLGFSRIADSDETREHKNARVLQIASISSLAGFIVQGMTDYSFYNYRVTFVFWAVLGIGALTTRQLTDNR